MLRVSRCVSCPGVQPHLICPHFPSCTCASLWPHCWPPWAPYPPPTAPSGRITSQPLAPPRTPPSRAELHRPRAFAVANILPQIPLPPRMRYPVRRDVRHGLQARLQASGMGGNPEAGKDLGWMLLPGRCLYMHKAHMHICTYAHAHMHICTYAHMHICTYAHMHVRLYAHTAICPWPLGDVRSRAQTLHA